MKNPIQKKLVYFGMELSIYLIDKTRIVTSQKNDPLNVKILLNLGAVIKQFAPL